MRASLLGSPPWFSIFFVVLLILSACNTSEAGESNDGTGAAARFNFPIGVATDRTGNVYVSDTSNYTIRKITPTGVVTTLAGSTGAAGHVDGQGAAAKFDSPGGIATDSAGNVYVADGAVNNYVPHRIVQPTGNFIIRKINPAGVVTTLAGNGFGHADGAGANASFRNPSGLATDSAGNVYVADTYNHTIRKITPAGVVTTLAGIAESVGSIDGTGASARFNLPCGVATDSADNVYVADTGNHIIRKITPVGVVTTLRAAGLPSITDDPVSEAIFGFPGDVAISSTGNVYATDMYKNTIRKITPAGVMTIYAGLGFGYDDDTGKGASFFNPTGIAIDSADNVYVADTGNHIIRKITPAGVVTTLAGTAWQHKSNGRGRR